MLTATAAGTLLAALWFVPSAGATQNQPGSPETNTTTTTTTHAGTTTSASTSTSTSTSASTSTDANAEPAGPARAVFTQSGEGVAVPAGAHTRLADTGSFDTTPYIVGGTLFLTLGAGFVVHSVRRERFEF
ncbi:hypothetical protein GCM10010145_05630 [Streptomyces ruber]|uniref:Cell wall protein n=2 Tax=Streptomyces TaxID=1883 RepID=A0A918EQ51_9ACTN|nr:hypothetical protein GCM10010145_05630 [Streptomyces ruber]